MDNRDSKSERILEVDGQYPSPEDRANVVWEIIRRHAPDLTTWDIVCFSAQFLGWQSENLPWIGPAAKHLLRLIFTAHYMDRETDIPTGLKRDGNSSKPDNPRELPAGEPPRKFLGLDVSGGGFE